MDYESVSCIIETLHNIYIAIEKQEVSRREAIARVALGGLLANPEYRTESLANLVSDAVKAADILIKELGE
jgi:hypothetical protein